jgi:hypothetical protein
MSWFSSTVDGIGRRVGDRCIDSRIGESATGWSIGVPNEFFRCENPTSYYLSVIRDPIGPIKSERMSLLPEAVRARQQTRPIGLDRAGHPIVKSRITDGMQIHAATAHFQSARDRRSDGVES